MKKWMGLIVVFKICAWEDIADELSFEEPPLLLFISLGSHCEPAVMLRHHGLRSTAFPFDWLVTIDHEGLLSLLEEDFQYFLDPTYLFHLPHYSECIENSYYKVEFKHDGPLLEQKEVWQKVLEKYQRRMDRFRSLRHFPGKVFFIRAAYDLPEGGPTYWLKQTFITSEQAKSLKSALDSYFPQLDFTLIIVNYQEDLPTPIFECERVIEFKIRKTRKHDDYKTILSALQDSAKFLFVKNPKPSIDDFNP